MKKAGSSKRVTYGIVGLALVGMVSLGGCSNTADVNPSTEPTLLPTPISVETAEPTPKVEAVALTYTELSSKVLELFEVIYSKYEVESVTNEVRLEAELIDVQSLISSNPEWIPENACELYQEWRDKVHPYIVPTDEPKDSEDLNQTTIANVVQSEAPRQSQTPSSKLVDTSKFVYPENSSTELLTADMIAEGLYYRTDKDNKVYDQGGNYQGYRIMTHEDIIYGSSEHDDELYGNDTSGSMLYTGEITYTTTPKSSSAPTSSTFTYPPNSTTEGLSAPLIEQGFYVRTDKDNKVYDQSGQYQGFSLGTKDDIIHPSTEHNDELYGNDDGSMLDTSGAH